jgi:hypothetical protein
MIRLMGEGKGPANVLAPVAMLPAFAAIMGTAGSLAAEPVDSHLVLAQQTVLAQHTTRRRGSNMPIPDDDRTIEDDDLDQVERDDRDDELGGRYEHDYD